MPQRRLSPIRKGARDFEDSYKDSSKGDRNSMREDSYNRGRNTSPPRRRRSPSRSDDRRKRRISPTSEDRSARRRNSPSLEDKGRRRRQPSPTPPERGKRRGVSPPRRRNPSPTPPEPLRRNPSLPRRNGSPPRRNVSPPRRRDLSPLRKVERNDPYNDAGYGRKPQRRVSFSDDKNLGGRRDDDIGAPQRSREQAKRTDLNNRNPRTKKTDMRRDDDEDIRKRDARSIDQERDRNREPLRRPIDRDPVRRPDDREIDRDRDRDRLRGRERNKEDVLARRGARKEDSTDGIGRGKDAGAGGRRRAGGRENSLDDRYHDRDHMAGKSDRGRRVVDKDKDRDDSKSDRGLVIKDNDRDDKRSGRGREREREDDKARDRDRDKRRDGDRDDKTVLRNKKVVRELELAGDEQELSIFCGTWNLHGKEPPSDLTDFIPRNQHDVYVIGTQECLRVIAQAVVFPSKDKWVKILTEHMGPQYTAVADETLAAVHVAVFIRNDLFKQVGRVGTDRVATGIANIIGNKGGVGVSMDIGTTSFLFVCAHFAAHQEQVARRNLDFKKINNKLKLGLERQPDVALAQDRFERVFWMGDLNYRVNGTRKMVDVLMKRDMHEVMLANDQLIMEMDKREVFKGFEEGDITFKPTYKFDTGFDRYDTSSKQRIPAWTDRVLYKRSRKVKLEKYDACADVRSSDHKPVYAIFSVAFVPLERKAEAAPDLSGKSSACSIM